MKESTAQTPPLTIRDIAKIAGVSITTASYALNNVGRVSVETRERILKIAAEIGYAPSLAARSLKGQKGRVIAVLTEGMGGPWYGEIMEGLQAYLNQEDYPVIACSLHDGALSLCKSLIADGLVLGTVVFNPGVTCSALFESIINTVPSIFLGKDSGLMGSVNFCLDNQKGEETLVEHLWQQGYRDFVWLDGTLETSYDAQERWASFSSAIKEKGGDPLKIMRLNADFQTPLAFNVVEKILEEGKRPRVIVAANDQSAMGAVSAIKKIGLRVPDDIAVAGFDGLDATAWTDPPITTLSFDRRHLGRLMAAKLIEVLSHEINNRVEIIPVSLQIRTSTQIGVRSSYAETTFL